MVCLLLIFMTSLSLCIASDTRRMANSDVYSLEFSTKNATKRASTSLPDKLIEETLIEFWHATNGPYWSPRQWNFEGLWQNWPGIEMDDDGLVFEIDLGGNNLSGTLPSSLAFIPINYLGLRSNELYGTIPASFCASSVIATLLLSSNALTGEIPDCIGNASTLTSLSIASNQLSGTIPESFYDLRQLIYVTFNGNNLTGTISDSIGQLQRLHSLDLSNNQLSGTLPHTMGNMTSIRQLLLGNNRLGGNLTKELLYPLINIVTKFVLAHNDFEGSLRPLAYIRNATVINVSHNRFSDPPPIRSFSKIVYLDMSFNHLVGTIDVADFLLFSISDFAYFNIRGNPLLKPAIDAYGHSSLTLLPLTFSGDTLMKTSEDNWSCKSVSPRGAGMTLLVDPAFLNYSHCACIRGYYGYPPSHCFPCPTNSIYCNNGVQLTIPPGMFAYPVLDSKPSSTSASASSIGLSPRSINAKLGAESEYGHSLLSSSFWNLERLEQNTLDEASLSLQHNRRIPPDHPQEDASTSNKNVAEVVLTQPVFFEPCFSTSACSTTCSISLGDFDNTSVAYMENHSDGEISPQSDGDVGRCHCNPGYSGRKCSHCVCDPNAPARHCYYRSARLCKSCKVVWAQEQSAALGIGLVAFILLVSLLIHVLVLRSKRKFDHSYMASKSMVRRAFYRILHVRTIGYFKLLLIFIQTLSAILTWPSSSIQRLLALLEITNGNPVGIGATCLWTGLRHPLVAYLSIALLPLILVTIFGTSIFFAHFIWRIVFRPNTVIYQLLPTENVETVSKSVSTMGQIDTLASDSIQSEETHHHPHHHIVTLNNGNDGDSTDGESSSSDSPSVPPYGRSAYLAQAALSDDEALGVSAGFIRNGERSENDAQWNGRPALLSSDSSSDLGDVPDVVAQEKSSIRYFSAFGLFVSEVLAISYFFYFGVTLSSLSFFTCETQHGTNLQFVQDYPWMSCYGKAAREVRVVTLPFLVLFTAGVPLFFASLLFYFRKTRSKRTVVDIIGGLFRCYRQELFWWEMVVLARRLGLALVLRIPRTSSFHSWSVVLVLVISVSLQFLFQPFQREGENRAEEASLLLLIISYVAQEISRSSPSSSEASSFTHLIPLFWVSVSLNVLFIIVIIGLILKAWWTTPLKRDDD